MILLSVGSESPTCLIRLWRLLRRRHPTKKSIYLLGGDDGSQVANPPDKHRGFGNNIATLRCDDGQVDRSWPDRCAACDASDRVLE